MTSSGLRRVMHAASASLLLIARFGSFELLRTTLLLIAAAAAVVETVRIARPEVHDRLADAVPAFRPAERGRPSGAMWLAFGLALAAWFPPRAAIAGILAGTLADPAASWIGGWLGGAARKSWAGSTAALAVTFAGAMLAGLAWPTALAAALVGAGLERWSAPIDDNLALAPGVALAVRLLA